MAVNIGPRIGVEGEEHYRQQMKNIIQATKTLKSELAATESSFNKNDSAMKKAAERAKLLRDAIKDQKNHIVIIYESKNKLHTPPPMTIIPRI